MADNESRQQKQPSPAVPPSAGGRDPGEDSRRRLNHSAVWNWIAADLASQQSAAERVQLLALAVEQSPIAVIITNIRGAIQYVNPHFTQLTGYDAADVIGANPRLLKSDLTAHATYVELWNTILSGAVWSGTLQNRRKNGELYWTSCIIQGIADAHGQVVHLLALQEDISARRQAEDRLRQEQARARAILDNIPHLAWLKDTESRFLAVNERFAHACGHSRAMLIGKTDLDIWPRALAERYRTDDREVIANGRQKWVEEPVADRGQTRWFETFKTPIVDNQGRCIGTTGLARDITERKQAELALREANRRLEEAQRIAGLGDWELDRHDHILHGSAQLFRIFGLPENSLGLPHRAFLERVHPEDRSLVRQASQAALVSGTPYAIEYRIIRSDGVVRWVCERGEYKHSKPGHITRSRGTLQDISAYKEVELRLAEQQGLLRSVLNASPDLIFFKDRNSRYIGCNKAFEAYTGCPEDAIIGLDDHAFVAPEIATLYMARDREALATGHACSHEEVIRLLRERPRPSGRGGIADGAAVPLAGTV